MVVERWQDNSVIVSESFDTATAAKLRAALREDENSAHAANLHNVDRPQEGLGLDSLSQEEIGLRLLKIPAFQRFAEQVGWRMAQAMTREALQ